MMLSPRRQTFDLNVGLVGNDVSNSATTSTSNTNSSSSSRLGNGACIVNSSSRSRSNSTTITFSEPIQNRTKEEEQIQQQQRMPYRDRKLSESVVSLTHVLEEEENITPSTMMTVRTDKENEMKTPIGQSINTTHFTASPLMARSTSQRRISQEINLRNGGILHSPRSPGFSQQSTNEGPSSVTPQRMHSGGGGGMARRNSARGSNGIALTRNYPTRSMSNGGGGIGGLTLNAMSNNKDEDYFGTGASDDGFSEIASNSSAAVGLGGASQSVPFPRSFSTSHALTSDSPSARRIGRHLSLSGAQSSESVNLEPLSPRFADLVPATPRSSVGGGSNNLSASGYGGGGRKSHIRYSSDLQIARPNFTTSRSEASFDHSSRSRRSSEVGSLYANTLDDSASLSGVKLGRDPSMVKPSKHRLILTEEGKADVTLQLGNCIGRGQFGSVYRALNLNTGQMVAVKRIKLNNRSEDEVTQLMHEVELLKSLVHPSVVKYEGLVRGEDVVSIVLEYVENGSLLHTLKAFGNFPEKLVASYVIKILEGLHYLHEMKVVHCDLKAANILTTKNGNVKLSDFGVSLNLKAAEDLKKNDAIGTPNWMAPEVIELKGASTAADIWSLGCTIIELLTGKPPYGDMLAMSAMWRIVEDECPPLPKDISELLLDFLTQCFQKDPSLRPSAAVLNEHSWLKTTWGDHKPLRPQDSVPFFKRIASLEQRKGSIRKSLADNNGTLERKGTVGRTRQATVTQADIHPSLPARNSEPIGISTTVTNVMERSTSSPPTSASLRPQLLGIRAVSSPDAWSDIAVKPIKEGIMENENDDSQSNVNIALYSPAGASTVLSASPPTMIAPEAMGRRGSDVTSTNTSFDILRSPSTLAGIEKDRNGTEPTGIPLIDNSLLDLSSPSTDVFMLDEQASLNKSHAFVKSSFSKAVSCKICREPVKKHAILCEECGLICHASCAKRAMTPCNLRAQLLMMANNQRSSIDVSRVLSPTPSANSPPPPPTPTSGTPIFRFPFGKYKRNSKAGASDLNLPSTVYSSSPQTTIVDSDVVGLDGSKSPPLTPLTPKDASSIPSIPVGEDGNKRQKRSRRISLLPSHLMRQRSHSPSPTSPAPSKPIVISPRKASATDATTATSMSTTTNSGDINESTSMSENGMIRSPSSSHSNHEDSADYGSSASSMSSSFHLGSPTSQMSSNGRSQFPSIEIRNINEQSVQFAVINNGKKGFNSSSQQQAQAQQDVPISRNALQSNRRQRHLSASAAALHIGSTPNLLHRGNSNQGEKVGVNGGTRSPPDVRPILPVRQASQGTPWSRARFDSSSGLSSNESILQTISNTANPSAGDRSMGAVALVLASNKEVGKKQNNIHSNYIEGNPTNTMFNESRNERRHHRRLSSKQDCVIA